MADRFPENPNLARDPVGYVCPACGQETCERYKPYCGDCGHTMPSQARMQALGMVNYPWDYGKPIRDVDGIAEFLKGAGSTRFWLQAYRPSFRASEIRFSESNGDLETHALICVWTERLQLPVGARGWQGILQLHGNPDVGYRLVDEDNDVEVCAGSVLLYTVERSLRTW